MRSVLISYLDRNKIIEIPSNTGCSDLEFLAKESKQYFAFGSNVNLRVTFQKYDSDWECFVDLEEGYAVVHKDKLKAVITPLLRDSSSVATDTEVSLL